MSTKSTNASRSRSEQREATREALLAAGTKVFAAKGHDGVNLAKDILDPVGISVGSFYHQFNNKTELLVAIIERATTRAQDRFLDSLPEDRAGMGPEVVKASWSAFLSLVDEAEHEVTIQLREAHSPHPEISTAIKKLTDARLAHLARRYRDIAPPGTTIDADAIVEMSAALSLAALTAYLHTPQADRPRRKAELVHRLTTMIFAGVPGFIHLAERDDQPIDRLGR